jgi:hypothetical protein
MLHDCGLCCRCGPDVLLSTLLLLLLLLLLLQVPDVLPAVRGQRQAAAPHRAGEVIAHLNVPYPIVRVVVEVSHLTHATAWVVLLFCAALDSPRL